MPTIEEEIIEGKGIEMLIPSKSFNIICTNKSWKLFKQTKT